MKWIVYIMRFPNKKKYIGVTKHSLSVRVGQHIKAAVRGSDLTLSCAIRKYGTDLLKTGVLARCVSDVEAKSLEVEYIKEIGTLRPCGYNSTVGGNGVIDPSCMSEKKRLVRMKRTMATSEYKHKQHQIQEQVWDKERRTQRSDEIKQLWTNVEYRKKTSEAHVRLDAKCHQPKVLLTHAERSAVQRLALNRPAVRKKMSVSAKKVQNQPGVKERKRAFTIKQMANPLFKKQFTAKMKEVMQDKNVRARCSESQKKRKPCVRICQKCGGEYVTKAINQFNKDRCPGCRDSLAISQFMSAMRQKRVA